MKSERTQYRERTPWRGLAYVVLWSTIVLACYPVLAGADDGVPEALRLPLVISFFGLGVAILALVSGLTVLVQETRIVMHLGHVPLVRRTIAFSEIESLKSVTYRPLREFGGWGVRGIGKRKAWTARGNRAVELSLSEGRQLLIGSDRPQRLAERIRTLGRL